MMKSMRSGVLEGIEEVYAESPEKGEDDMVF